MRSIAALPFTLAACSAPEVAPEAARLLIDGGMVVVMDEAGTVLDGGAVLVEGERIVGLLDRAAPRPAGVRTLDATGQIVIPGLINTHGHAAMSLLRGLADDEPLLTWLEETIFPAEAALVAPDFVYAGTLLSSIEMLKSGTTTFADMYYFPDDVVRATTEAGVRAVAGPTVIGFPAPDFPTPAESMAHAEGFFARHRDEPLLIPSVSAHALYTTSLKDVEAALKVANEHGAVFQIHVAEGSAENDAVREMTGMRVVEALDSIGALRPGTVLAHSIHLNDEDVARIAAGGAGVAHNPESNMKFAEMAAAPVRDLLAAGVPVGLGTDGPASNNDLDMFGEMDMAAKIHKFVSGDPTALPAKTVFRMATMGSAEVIGQADRLGSLEPGKLADVVLVDARRAGMTPLYNPYSHLVYTARGGDVSTVLVHGRVVVENGAVATVDEAAVMEAARGFGDRVREALSAR